MPTTKSKAPSTPHGRLIGVGLVLLAVVIGLLATARIWTEVLWYRSVEAPQVYFTRLWAAVGLFALFGALMFGAIGANMTIANRLHRSGSAPKPANQPVWLHSRAFVVAPAAAIGLLAGLSASARRDTLLAWWQRTPFGESDSYFGQDVGFYVFSLPWWQFVMAMIMVTLVVSGLAAAAVHLINGSLKAAPIKLHAPTANDAVPDVEINNPFGRAAQAHLSVVVGLILVVVGVQSLLARYAYVYSDNGLFTGIGYTEARSRIIARLVMAIIAFICALVFFANALVRRWAVALSAIGLMAVSSLVIALIYPMIVQRFFVKPDEPNVQRPYIATHIEATRAAYGLDAVEVTEYSAQTQTSAGQLKADAEALPGIRLMDPAVIAPTFEQLQQVRGYYTFPAELKVDRYTIDGQATDAIVAAREIDQAGMPDQSWNNVHTVFTHGFGMVAAYGNRRAPSGEPSWITGDIPPVGVLPQEQARIYFGERTTTYAIVGAPPGAEPVELDTPGGGSSSTETRNTYEGTGGVPVGGMWHRLLFALRYTDLNLILNRERVNPYSVILYDRTPTERVAKVAPWLSVDSSSFPAIVDGRLVWILDGYTTTDRYPNSQLTSVSGADPTTSTQLNYIRNSVKATVDALDGTVRLYAWDESDPILRTWMKVFPGTVEDASQISADLMSHLRYPQDIFKVQRQVLARYHITDANTWYQQSDLWEVPDDPRGSNTKEPPYYLSIKWPGDEAPVFSQTAAYVPKGRQNLGAYLAVVADAASPDYGRLRVLKLSASQQIAGPGQTHNAISTDQLVADKLLPFTRGGSAQAIWGNLLTLPLGGGLIYVEPIYTQRVGESGGSGSYPVLRFVAVRFGDQIGIGSTLQEALDMVFKGDAGASTGEDTPSDPGEVTPPSDLTPAEVADAALKAAADAFAAADTALKAGDLAEYQHQVDLARAKVSEAQAALA